MENSRKSEKLTVPHHCCKLWSMPLKDGRRKNVLLCLDCTEAQCNGRQMRIHWEARTWAIFMLLAGVISNGEQKELLTNSNSKTSLFNSLKPRHMMLCAFRISKRSLIYSQVKWGHRRAEHPQTCSHWLEFMAGNDLLETNTLLRCSSALWRTQ